MKIVIWARVGVTLLLLAAAAAHSQPAASPEANDATHANAAAIAAAKKTLADASLPSSDDPLVLARSLVELALADAKQKNFARAEASCLTALTLQEHAPGSNERAMVQTLFRLGNLQSDQDHYAQAEQYDLRSLDMAGRAFPDRGMPIFGAVLHSLGAAYDNDGDVAKAEPVYLRSVAAFGDRDPRGPAIALRSLGDLYFKTARLAQAVPVEQRLGPSNQPKRVTHLEALAKLYREMGRISEADALEREAATRRATSGGK